MSRVVAVLALLAVVAAACTGAAADDDCDLPGVRPGLCPTAVEDRREAPVDAVPVLGGDGEERSLAELRGEVVVVNFWASWCGPCRAEQPDLNEAHDVLAGQGVRFLGVNIEDTEANARAHQREFDIPYESLFDRRNAYASRFEGVGPRTIPTTVFVDAEGRVAARLFGSPRDATEVVALVEHLLAEGRGSEAAAGSGVTAGGG